MRPCTRPPSSPPAQVYNPVACTAEAAALFDSIPGSARVEHVVLPSLLADHWYHTPGWADRFAGATIWTAPGGCMRAAPCSFTLSGITWQHLLSATRNHTREGNGHTYRTGMLRLPNVLPWRHCLTGLLECAFPATIVGGKERVQQLLASFPPGAVRTMPMTGPLPGLDGQVRTAGVAVAGGHQHKTARQVLAARCAAARCVAIHTFSAVQCVAVPLCTHPASTGWVATCYCCMQQAPITLQYPTRVSATQVLAAQYLLLHQAVFLQALAGTEQLPNVE